MLIVSMTSVYMKIWKTVKSRCIGGQRSDECKPYIDNLNNLSLTGITFSIFTYHFLCPSKSKKPGFVVLHFPTLAWKQKQSINDQWWLTEVSTALGLPQVSNTWRTQGMLDIHCVYLHTRMRGRFWCTHLFVPGVQVEQLVPAGCLDQVSYSVRCAVELPQQVVSLQPVSHLHPAAVKFTETQVRVRVRTRSAEGLPRVGPGWVGTWARRSVRGRRRRPRSHCYYYCLCHERGRQIGGDA